MFGATPPPQHESTAFYPRSPYGAAKLYSHWVTVNYREAYDLFAVSGILFNHESPRRGESFVTRKITLGVAAIKLGVTDHLDLGNLDAVRDWGYAPEYVEGMWRMLQHDEPHGLRAGHRRRHHRAGVLRGRLRPRRPGLGGPRELRQQYERPTEVDALIGDASKAREVLGWKAQTNADRPGPADGRRRPRADGASAGPVSGAGAVHLVTGAGGRTAGSSSTAAALGRTGGGRPRPRRPTGCGTGCGTGRGTGREPGREPGRAGPGRHRHGRGRPGARGAPARGRAQPRGRQLGVGAAGPRGRRPTG